MMSIIGTEANARGELSTQEAVEIQGEFRGKIRSRSRLTVAPGGRMEGQVEAPQVVVQGHLVGDVKSTRQLEVLSGGCFRGQLLIQPDVLILSPQADFGDSPGVK